MRTSIKKFVFLGICILGFYSGIGQSIGYSFSYSLPYQSSNDYFFDDGPTINEKYSKGAELSIGLLLNNFNNKTNSVQIKLSRYSSSFEESRLLFGTSRFGKTKTDRLYIELEGYFISQGIKNIIFFDLGVKYAYLLWSDHDSHVVMNNVKTISKNPDYGGLAKYKFELLLKIRMKDIAISKSLSIVPSYVFGYGISNDFNSNRFNTTALNHRFEISLFKKMEEK